MGAHAIGLAPATVHPVQVRVAPALDERERLTVAFRILLALPHLVLVGGPLAAVLTWERRPGPDTSYFWTAGGGLLGAVAIASAIIAWFAILFTGHYPEGLRSLVTYYLRWRVRVSAYVALLRDEYPPFGDGPYAVELDLPQPTGPQDRLTVAFRPLLAFPHLIAIWFIGIAWVLTTLVAWFAILFTGRYPERLYWFGVGALRWTTRVEAYLFLLRDEYPPFTLS
jgi:hypothetical protein